MKNRLSVATVAELMNVSEQFIRIGLQNLIVKALNDWFEQLFAIFEEWFPEFKGQLVLDTGALVAETAPAMDEELGKIIRRKERQ